MFKYHLSINQPGFKVIIMIRLNIMITLSLFNFKSASNVWIRQSIYIFISGILSHCLASWCNFDKKNITTLMIKL